ncbi:uncharacterized protein LOC133180641 [Saccostrea echinata]|uniref:uncharacterized protein LOC133180641 n=1 Tax=Saccostrea echinata TaxID=191078 RepID=UPI002A804FC4|nr:uncharacterized protein LOC133180641 [Saccostrea echinata]
MTYESLGPERGVDSINVYKSHINDLSVSTQEACRDLCDHDQQCKAFGFSKDIFGVRCTLSEDIKTYRIEGCATCFVYLKNCSADCITYTMYSSGYIGTKQYANYDPSNYTACRDRCSNDVVCNGFIHNSVTQVCRLVDSSSPAVFAENTNFSFSRKECDFGCSTYLGYGIGYILPLESYYDIMDIRSGDCEQKCNNNSLCRGFAVIDDWDKCGLSFSARKQKWTDCSTCSAYIKLCSSCYAYSKQCPLGNYSIEKSTCLATTYAVYNGSYEASSIYSIITATSYTACQSRCSADHFCHGFTFNHVTETCSLSESLLPRTSNCAECFFSAKDCSSTTNRYSLSCSSTFTIIGQNLTIFPLFTTHNDSDFIRCQQLCVDDTSCLSFYHRSVNNDCHLSKSSVLFPSACPTCEYYRRNCLPDCSLVTFVLFELGYTMMTIKNDLAGQNISFEECQRRCHLDTYCFGCGYYSDTIRCVLSDSSVPVWSPSQLSSSFSQKVCSPDSTTKPTSLHQLTTGKTEPQTTDIFQEQQSTEISRQQQTTGTIKQQTTEISVQQSTDISRQQQTTGISTQQTIEISVQPVLKTTEQGQTTEISSQLITTIQRPTPVNRQIITNGSVQCICVCKDTAQSLQEKLSQRKNDLTVNSKTLSSRLRKQTSVADSRLLSCAIGAVGAIILGGFVALIVLPDLCQSVSYVIKIFYVN